MTASRASGGRSGGIVRDGTAERSALFYIGFALLYIKTMAAETSLIELPEAVDAALLLASACFFVFHCVQRARDFDRPVWFLIAVGVFLVANYCLTGLTTQMTAFLFVVAASFGVDMKRFVSFWFRATGFFFVALVVFYLILYVAGSDLATSVVRSGGGTATVRLSFFFKHPNGAATVAMMLAGALLYLNRGNKLKFTHYASVFIAAIFVIYTTDSRTSALLTLALIPLYLVSQGTKLFESKAIRTAVGLLPVALFALVYMLAGPLYSASVASLFTGRVWLWHTILLNSGVTVLGQAFVPASATSYYGSWDATATTLDSFYASGLMTMGLLVSALFCWAVFRTSRHARQDEMACLPLLVVLLLHGITESGVLAAAIAFPLIFLSIALRGKSEGLSTEEAHGDAS